MPKYLGGGVFVKTSLRRLAIAAFVSLASFAATHFWYQSTAPSSSNNSNQKPVAFVNRTKDEIHRRPVTRIIWQLISDGEPLFPGEAIRTSSDGEVRIQFAEGSRYIDLESDSLIVISQATNNEIALDLVDGSLMVNQGSSQAATGQGPALTLKSGENKVDLSQATASLTKSGSTIDLQVLKGKAKVQSKDQIKELESGNSGALGAHGINFKSQELKIISPSLEKPVYMNPEAPTPITFSWKGFPKNAVVTVLVGTHKKNLKLIGESKEESLSLKLNIGKYYWKLVAKDPSTQQILGESSLNRTEIAARFAPALITPQADEKILKSNPKSEIEFRWTTPDETKNVYLEIAKDAKFTEKVFSKNLLKENYLKQVLPDGEYFVRMSAIYEGIEKPITSRAQKFYLSLKPFDPPVIIDWTNPEEKTPQFFISQPSAELSWLSEQKNQVQSWRLSVAESEDALATAQALKFETKDQNYKPILEKPGRYIAMVEAVGKSNEVLARSPIKSFEIAPLPLLPAPKFNPETGDLSASNQGKLDLSWSSIDGAKEYQLTLYDKSGNEIKTSKFSKNSTALQNLLPGTYQVAVAAIDKHGRLGQKDNPRNVLVPNSSGLSAPKLKKIKVN